MLTEGILEKRQRSLWLMAIPVASVWVISCASSHSMPAPVLRGRHCFCSPSLHQHLWKGCSEQRQTPSLLRGGAEMWGIASQHFVEHGTSHVLNLWPWTILFTSPNPHFIVSKPVIITAWWSSCEDYMAVTILIKAGKECVTQWKHSAKSV